jgi:hypothetical protein
MATTQAQADPVETGPEIGFSVYTRGNTSALTVEPALSPSQIEVFRSTLAEVIEEKMLPWCEEPTAVIGVREGLDESSKRSTLMEFPIFGHFGKYRDVHAKNAALIIEGIVELDRSGFIPPKPKEPGRLSRVGRRMKKLLPSRS